MSEERYRDSRTGLGSGAKLAIGAAVLATTAIGAHALGFFDGLLGRRKAGSSDSPESGAVDPNKASSEQTSPAAPLSSSGQASDTVPAAPQVGVDSTPPELEYVFSDVSPLALSRFRELAGIADRPQAMMELEAANPGIDFSNIQPGFAVRIPRSWPRIAEYRPATPSPSQSRDRRSAGRDASPAPPRAITVHPDGRKESAPPTRSAPARRATGGRGASPLAALLHASRAAPALPAKPGAVEAAPGAPAKDVKQAIAALATAVGAPIASAIPTKAKSPLAGLIGAASVAAADLGVHGVPPLDEGA